MKFYSVCAPVYLYIIISVISLLISMSKSFDIIGNIILFNLIIILIWGLILYFLCIKGYSIIAWILLILPLVGLFKVINNS